MNHPSGLFFLVYDDSGNLTRCAPGDSESWTRHALAMAADVLSARWQIEQWTGQRRQGIVTQNDLRRWLGYDAARRGASRTACPFPTADRNRRRSHDAWHAGFNAYDDEQARQGR